MAHTTTEITKPVTTTDVSQVLAVASHNIGYLCSNQHGKINRWSKYKPVPLNNPFPSRAANSIWYKGSDGKCGLVPVYVTSIDKIPGAYTELFQTDGWAYNPPKGGSTEPFRFGDFDLYKHDARPPFSMFVCTNKLAKGDTFSAGFAENLIGADGYPTSVTLTDIKSADGVTTLADFYFGVAFCRDGSTSVVGKVTSTQKGGHTLDFAVDSLLQQGTSYRVYPFLSKKRIDWMGTDTAVDNEFYPFPCVRVDSDTNVVKIVSAEEAAGVSLRVIRAYYASDTSISVTIKVTAERGLTINSGTVQARYLAEDQALSMGEPSAIIQERILKAGESWQQSFLLRPVLAEKRGHYYISVLIYTNYGVFKNVGFAIMDETTTEQ